MRRRCPAWGSVPVAGLCRAGFVPIDDDDLGAALLGFEHERPVMQVGRDRVAGPDDDVLAMHEAFRVDAAGGPMRQKPCRRRARRAVGLLVDRRAEAIEEWVAGIDALHEAHVAEIALRHDRLAPYVAMISRQRLPISEMASSQVMRSKLPRPFGPDAAQRIHQPVRIGVMIVEILELHAQAAPRERVVLVAACTSTSLPSPPRNPWRRCPGSRAGTRQKNVCLLACSFIGCLSLGLASCRALIVVMLFWALSHRSPEASNRKAVD